MGQREENDKEKEKEKKKSGWEGKKDQRHLTEEIAMEDDADARVICGL
jgi:hypothetical protein